MPGAARGRGAQNKPRIANHKLLGSLSKTSQSMSKTRSLDQIQAMMDSSDDDTDKMLPTIVNPAIRTISKPFVECDNCGSKFRGEIPAVHLMECKNIPIKEEPSIDEIDDLNFMPGTPETQEEPIFKLGSNYPSGFGMLLANALQNDLKHNGIDDDGNGNETEGEVQRAPEQYGLDQISLDKELEAEIIEIRDSSHVSTTMNKETTNKTMRKRAKTPPHLKKSKISKTTNFKLNSDIIEISTPDAVSTKKPASHYTVQKSPESALLSTSAKIPLANKSSQSPAKIPTKPSTKPSTKPPTKPSTTPPKKPPQNQPKTNFKPNVPNPTASTKPTPSKPTLPKTTPTGIAQTWYKLKKGDIIFCLWCHTEMNTSTTTTCVCTHENYHVKKIKQFSMPSFLLNNEKLKSKPGYSDFTKDWMICYRCGMCLTKDRKKLLAHVTKNHENGDERESCHYCPKKFFDDEEAFDHKNAG